MKTANLSTKTASAGMLAALTASLCCITPVLAFFSGVSGIAATFSWIEPVRPYLIGLTSLVLGFAWYLQLRPQSKDVDCDCEDEHTKRPFIQTKSFLGIVTVVAAVLLAFPSYSNIFYPKHNKSEAAATDVKLNLVTLEVAGMTCTGCEDHVKYATMELEGVVSADASWEDEIATIIFNQDKTPLDNIIQAINATGYQVQKVKSVVAADASVLKINKTNSNQ